MEKDWVKVKSFAKLYIAEIAKEVLKDNEIESVILNKQDTSYLIGDIEIYVAKSNAAKAIELLEQLN